MARSAGHVVIAGAGVAGLSLALALKQGLGRALDVTICAPASKRDAQGDLRAYALAAGARRMLETLGVWAHIETGSQPILGMTITDSRLKDPVRPVFLTFSGEVEPGEPFAHMVESAALSAALREAAEAAGVSFVADVVTRGEAHDASIAVRLAGGQELRASLLVAADGAQSPARRHAGIGWVGWSYRQEGIVATLSHSQDHEGRAYEHFLPSGPFAMLPLPGRRSSIVWSERQENVGAILALDHEDLLAEIERRFGPELGDLKLESPAVAYPLSFGIARRFVGPRLALVGDAAHLIHPIAGQGMNIGFRDTAALAETIADAVRLGLDPGNAESLEAYERARRFDTLTMGLATDGLNRLFSNDLLPVRLARDLGLGLVERMPGLKRFFIREAAGVIGAAPKLLRGETL